MNECRYSSRPKRPCRSLCSGNWAPPSRGMDSFKASRSEPITPIGGGPYFFPKISYTQASMMRSLYNPTHFEHCRPQRQPIFSIAAPFKLIAESSHHQCQIQRYQWKETCLSAFMPGERERGQGVGNTIPRLWVTQPQLPTTTN